MKPSQNREAFDPHQPGNSASPSQVIPRHPLQATGKAEAEHLVRVVVRHGNPRISVVQMGDQLVVQEGACVVLLAFDLNEHSPDVRPYPTWIRCVGKPARQRRDIAHAMEPSSHAPEQDRLTRAVAAVDDGPPGSELDDVPPDEGAETVRRDRPDQHFSSSLLMTPRQQSATGSLLARLPGLHRGLAEQPLDGAVHPRPARTPSLRMVSRHIWA